VGQPDEDLFLVDTLSSTLPVNLTRDQANYQSVSWSPDGAMLLFVKIPAGAPFTERDIYTLRLSDLALTKLTARSGAYVLPAWSPDGTHVVFGEEELFLGPLNLFIMNADGSGLRQLTAGQHRDNGPCWMP
jgi:TolB protein